jgi:hypothetical protein
MSLDAKFELRIDCNLVMEIRVHPKTAADAVADMLEDAAATIREGVDSMMEQGEGSAECSTNIANQREALEPLPVEWRCFKDTSGITTKPARLQLVHSAKGLTSTTTH